MSRLLLKGKFQALSAEESRNIKGGLIKPKPPGGGIGGTPPPVTTGTGNGDGDNSIMNMP
jgi:hypothetical protein